MSENNNGNNGGNSGAGVPKVPMGTKISYIGTGVLIGLIAYPFVRKALAKVQPQVDKLFDDLTGKAEDYAEKASDLLAKAKMSLKTNGHAHGHDHSHDEDTDEKSPIQ